MLQKKGYIMFIATSKPTIFAKEIASYLQIDHFFEGVIGSNLDNSRSNKAEIIEHIIEKYSIKDRDRIVMVGDRSHDLIGAKQCKIHGVGVTYGYGSNEELEAVSHDVLISSINELLSYLEK